MFVIQRCAHTLQIMNSLGKGDDTEIQDVVSLVKSVAKVKGEAVFKTQNVAITLQMLGRFAFLVRSRLIHKGLVTDLHLIVEQRLVFVEQQDHEDPAIRGMKYWKRVDDELQRVRNSCAGLPKTFESQ